MHHFRQAVRFDPELAAAHYNLAEIRAYEGALEEAIAHYRQALRIDPAFAPAESLLGVALAGRGRLDAVNDRRRETLRIDPEAARARDIVFGDALNEGVDYYHQAYWIGPTFTASYNNLGFTTGDASRLNEAIGHYEKALHFDPGLFRVHASLGQALLALGRFGEAEAATRRCLDRLPPDHELRANVEAQLRRCRRLTALKDGLPDVLQGMERPRGAAESLKFAELCGMQGRFAAAARLYADAFAVSPPPSGDTGSAHRYTAACAAALAGCSRGEDRATLGEADRARWRGQAREWLRADLAGWARILEGGAESDCFLVRRRLAHLWADPDLAVLFDHGALGLLPPAERQECRTLWGEVDALILRAQAR